MSYTWANTPVVGAKATIAIMTEIATVTNYINSTHCPSNFSGVQSSNYGDCSSNLNHTSMNFSYVSSDNTAINTTNRTYGSNSVTNTSQYSNNSSQCYSQCAGQT